MTDQLPKDRPLRIVFFGSDPFSVPALKALAAGPDDVVLAVTPPPARSGRGLKESPSPVALAAGELKLTVLEAKKLNNSETIESIKEARPDLLVVAAFGGFLPETLLKLCPVPPLNIHPSLLPRHRGPAPVSWTLIHGDRKVGVSIIFLEKEMDAGPVLHQRFYDLQTPGSAGDWEARLAVDGAEDLLLVIERLKQGQVQPLPQAAGLATVNPRLRKSDGRLNFSLKAEKLAGLINGVDPWPGAQATLGGKTVKLFLAEAVEGDVQAEPGTVLGLDDKSRLLLASGDGLLAVAELQPEGKKRMNAADFLRGYKPEKLGSAQ